MDPNPATVYFSYPIILEELSFEEAKASIGLSRSEGLTLIFDIWQRITFAEVIENEWFNKGYKAPKFENADVSLDDVDAIFDDSGVRLMFFCPFSVLRPG